MGLAAHGPAVALETMGYLRSGVGGSTNGGTQSCFQLPGALTKYRLGNECDQYIELGLKHDLATFDNGSVLSAAGMVSLGHPYGKTPDFRGPEGFTRLAQGWVQWSNLPQLNGGSVWAGRRYYKRNDININDFYYWDPSGTGFGVEDVAVGGLKYSYAFSRKDGPFQKNYATKHDFHVGGFQPNAGGELEFGLSAIQKPSEPESHGGWSLSVQHIQNDVLGGKNILATQFGRGPGTGMGTTGDILLGNQDWSWRLLDALDWQMGRWGGQIAAIYQKDRRQDGTNQDWLSLGVRPVYALTDTVKLTTEVGYDQVRSAGKTGRLTKFTIAPTWSPEGGAFWARPEIRLYYTYARWNKAAQQMADDTASGSALAANGPFGSARHGSNFGLQIEYWWK